MTNHIDCEVPLTTLLPSGLLFEINRRILHPVGLSLGIVIRKPRGSRDDEYERFEVIRVDLRKTNDPCGFVIRPEEIKYLEEKFAKFMEQQQPFLDKRKDALGFVIQENWHEIKGDHSVDAAVESLNPGT